jgi:hypothetical protein
MSYVYWVVVVLKSLEDAVLNLKSIPYILTVACHRI